MRLNREQEEMLSGKHGRGTQKAIEILVGLGEAQGAEELVKISYAHLMPPDIMFFPYGRQGRWAHEMTHELTMDIDRLRVTATIEPLFCDLCGGATSCIEVCPTSALSNEYAGVSLAAYLESEGLPREKRARYAERLAEPIREGWSRGVRVDS